ncbi:MAG: hypothetical protein ACYCWW_06845, partial [Deltaproteobacteria bacterium]
MRHRPFALRTLVILALAIGPAALQARADESAVDLAAGLPSDLTDLASGRLIGAPGGRLFRGPHRTAEGPTFGVDFGGAFPVPS